METPCHDCNFILKHEDDAPKKCPGCNKMVGHFGGLTLDDLNWMCSILQYSSHNLETAFGRLELDINDYNLDIVEHFLLTDAACARCAGCAWWYCVDELEPESGYCESCGIQSACF